MRTASGDNYPIVQALIYIGDQIARIADDVEASVEADLAVRSESS